MNRNNVSTLSHAAHLAENGYTLFTPNAGYKTWLIDMAGRFVHSWQLPERPGTNVRLLSNGHILAAVKNFDLPLTADVEGSGGLLLELDWDGNEVWRHVCMGQHHDAYPLANGNIMILRWQEVPSELAHRVRGGVAGTEYKGETMLADSLREIDRDGQTIWEWHFHDHLHPERDAICPLCHRTEWTHCNSVHELPDGNIMTTSLALNTIFIIDRKSDEIAWRWGPGELAHPHDPTSLDNGNILVFDNGLHRPLTYPSWSRVVELDPNSGEIKWEYRDRCPGAFFASFISGCQRLPGGNTLICNGPDGYFFEVTQQGEIVWEYRNPFFGTIPKFHVGHSNLVFRARRFMPDDPALAGKSLSPDRYAWVNQVYGPKS